MSKEVRDEVSAERAGPAEPAERPAPAAERAESAEHPGRLGHPGRPDPPDLPESPDPSGAPGSADSTGSADHVGPGVGPAAPPTRLEAFVSGGAYGVLAVGGAAVGLLGSFYHAVDVGPIPAFAVVFALLNLGAFRLAGWAMGTRLGAVAPALAWLLVVIFMSSRRPEGDLVISGSTAGYVYLLGGSITAIIAVARTRSATSWL